MSDNQPKIVIQDDHLRPTNNPANAGSPSEENSDGTAASPVNLQVPDLAGGRQTRSGSIVSTAPSIGPSDAGTVAPYEKGLMMSENELTAHHHLDPDFLIDHGYESKFKFTPGHFGLFSDPDKRSAWYHEIGGINGLENTLKTDLVKGLGDQTETLDDIPGVAHGIYDPKNYAKPKKSKKPKKDADATLPFHNGEVKNPFEKPVRPSDLVGARTDMGYKDRKAFFSDNRLPTPPSKSLFSFIKEASKDKVVIVLAIAAVVSLGLGLYQTFGTKSEHGEPKVEWVEGVAIMVAIVIVVGVGSVNDWQKELQFAKLNRKKESRDVPVIRNGEKIQVNVDDITVGDVVPIATGDKIPADGVVIESYGLKVSEASITGESDVLVKINGADSYNLVRQYHDGKIDAKELAKSNPFLSKGAGVTEGYGKFLVTGVGIFSMNGKVLMAVQKEDEDTPLQVKLGNMATLIAKWGGGIATVMFLILFFKFLAQLRHSHETPVEKAQDFLKILITSVALVVAAIPEGLPLAVTLALAFATKKMLKDNNLVRKLKSCETMGNATTICSDKTGTLTQNVMTVVKGRFCTLNFDLRSGAAESFKSSTKDSDRTPPIFTPEELNETLASNIKQLTQDSIVFNSTASKITVEGKTEYQGSKTEVALLDFAEATLGLTGDVDQIRHNNQPVHVFPFSSKAKCMGTVMSLGEGKGYRLFAKGASEILFSMCTQRISNVVAKNQTSIHLTDAGEQFKAGMTELITKMAKESLRTIALTYKDFETLPEFGDDIHEYLQGSAMIAIVGIQDPLRPGVTESVKACQNAGVVVRMVTGDNLTTARAIAEDCGILDITDANNDNYVFEGPDFRKLNMQRTESAEAERKFQDCIANLRVLARSSPFDKEILVGALKARGDTVAVTGDGTNDAAALKKADVGFAMGIAGTEVAKEASSIIIMDDNFSSIVKALKWGRAVNDAVSKFLQFQLTANITAVALTFVTAVASETEASVLTAVQLLWINLIMDTFAALALATDPPTNALLDRKPVPKSAPLISATMAKMIVLQSVYQIAVTLVLHFAGGTIFGYTTEKEIKQLATVVFNSFVWMQVFNMINCRRIDNRFNVLDGVLNNKFFLGILALMCGLQTIIVFKGGAAFSITEITGSQWAISLVVGPITILVGMIIRCIPDPRFWKWSNKEVTPSDLERASSHMSEKTTEDRPSRSIFHRPGRFNLMSRSTTSSS